MTNWLDPEQVKAMMRACDDYSVMAMEVLSALADLPEPSECCDKCHSIEASDIHKTESAVFGFWAHDYQPSLLHRLWTIARIVCGKPEGTK
jgi:hypothetical protein